MKYKSVLATLFVIALALTNQTNQVKASFAFDSAGKISDLAWMSGDWQTDPAASAVSEEHWTRPAGGSMLGMSRAIVGARTATFEFLRIEERPEGIFYVANPKGRCPATDFKL